jgi:myo-inositol-1(or 4)-monophosphatase
VAQPIFDSLRECAVEIGLAIVSGGHQGLSGGRETQYHLDVIADQVAGRLLRGAGFRVISEESGVTGSGELSVVVDPIDGSTNCDHGVPFYATSFAVLREDELVAALVVNQATGTFYEAERGSGAFRNGESIHPSQTKEISDAIVSFSGLPSQNVGWAQCRSLGAASLEICLVADGSLDIFTVAARSTLHPWDYLGGLLVVQESGAFYSEYENKPLITVEQCQRRPVFASSAQLLTYMMGVGSI